MRGRLRFPKWLLWTAAACVILIILVAAGTYWGLGLPGLRGALSHRIDQYVKELLGPTAAIADVKVGWNSVTVSQVSIPLDAAGSVLEISEAEIGISPANLLSSPKEPLRTVKSAHIRGAQFLIRSGRQVEQSPRSSFSAIAIPPSLYSSFKILDSLQSIVIEQASVTYLSPRDSLRLAEDITATITRSGNVSNIAGTGQYLDNPLNRISFSGQLNPDARNGECSILAELPEGRLPLLNDSLFTSLGGNVSLRLEFADTVAFATASATVEGPRYARGKHAFSAEHVRLKAAGDTVRIEPLTIQSDLGTGHVSGDLLVLSRSLNLAGHVILDSSTIKSRHPAELEFAICGSVSQPIISLSAPEIEIAGQRFREISAEAALSGGAAVIQSATLVHEFGRASLQGRVALDSTLEWSGSGRVVLDSLTLSRWHNLQLAAFDFTASGHAADLDARIVCFDKTDQRLADVTLLGANAEWHVDLTDASGRQGSAYLLADSSGMHMTLSGGQAFLHALVNDPNHLLEPVTSFALMFDGDDEEGSFELDATLEPDSLSLLPRIARELHFNGSYAGNEDRIVSISGQWWGKNGDELPFDGAADLEWRDQLITVQRLFIDQASHAVGHIDLRTNELNLEFEIADLAFDKLPFKLAAFKRAQIAGNTSGLIHLYGQISDPEWTARLAVVDGTVLGVPDYWLNLDAGGRGLQIQLHQFELGRDINRIIAARGSIDIPQNQISVTAEAGSGRAEDFVNALFGRRRLVSGTFDGRAAITGQFTRPDVEAELTVTDGLLLNQIYFTDLIATGRFSLKEDQVPEFRLTHFHLSNDTLYAFAGSAEAVTQTGGPLHVYLEGSGDFLSIVDQLDREFASLGSHGDLQIEVGGTVDHPQFIGGSLNVVDGLFTFPSATPVTVATDIQVAVNAQGFVETGLIALRNGEQEIRLIARNDWATAYPSLHPLVIPAPHVNLGVLEIRTGQHGMPVRIPGLMKKEWTGQVTCGTDGLEPIVISAENDSCLLISGDTELRNARLTFPFAGSGGRMRPVARWLVDRLIEAEWDLDVHVGPGNHYDVEITGLKDSDIFAKLRESPIFATLADYFDHLTVDAVIDPVTSPLQIRETIADTSFYLYGRLTSSRGRVEYLDQRFTIDYATCEFDETDIMPVLEGRASTTGIDTLGRRVPVYLTMYVIDRETQTRQRHGRLDDITYVLENDAGDPPEIVLAQLGYDVGTVGGKAQELVATSVVRAIGRQWLDPIERRLERWTLLDEVTLTPAGGRSASLTRQQHQLAAHDSIQSNGTVRFFTGSQLTVGKYLTNDVFLTYTGELSESENAPESGRLSLVHFWNLEYRIKPVSPDLVLDFAVEYDEFERRRDESVSLKYSFALEP